MSTPVKNFDLICSNKDEIIQQPPQDTCSINSVMPHTINQCFQSQNINPFADLLEADRDQVQDIFNSDYFNLNAENSMYNNMTSIQPHGQI